MLVKSPLLQAGSTRELVCSNDIFAVVHALFGLEIDTMIDAQVPPSMGGTPRSIVPIFGHTLMGLEDYDWSFELLLRTDCDQAYYYCTPAQRIWSLMQSGQFYEDPITSAMKIFPDSNLNSLTQCLNRMVINSYPISLWFIQCQ